MDMQPTAPLCLRPIGQVQHTDTGFRLVIEPPYRAGLKQLDQFSHVIVLWWADRHDNPQDRAIVETSLPYAPGVTAGVFACRAEYRPNPIGVSVSPILAVDVAQGCVELPWLEAFDGTPILDLKPYVPISDRVRDVIVAPWFEGLPEYLEDAAGFDFDAFFGQNG